MLLVGVSFGSLGDPFTTSTTLKSADAAAQGLDLENANQMREWFCNDKDLSDSEMIDELMIIYEDEEGEPQVQHWHYEF
jgi:hypothetical protein